MKREVRTREDGRWYLYPAIELDLDWKGRLILGYSKKHNVPYWKMELIIEKGAYPSFASLCNELSKLDCFKK